jgi:uncharacterized membrane protein HdeD (DUF308 family)
MRVALIWEAIAGAVVLLLGAVMAAHPARCLRIVNTPPSPRRVRRGEGTPRRRSWQLETRIVGVILIIVGIVILKFFHDGMVIVPAPPFSNRT